MKYVGSKNRLAKDIVPIINRYKGDRVYVEPFVGGANLIDKFSGIRYGNDVHPYLIALLKAVQTGWIPPSIITEKDYYDIKANSANYPPELVGFVGFCCSFSGKWFGGYARGNTSSGSARNYAREAKDNLLKQAPSLKDIIFSCGSYTTLNIPDNSLIYCDPPYKGTVKYSEDIDHDLFFKWCRDRVKDGHLVILSEYHAPEDFRCIFSKQVNNTLNLNTGEKKGIEKLFILGE